MKLTFLGTGTSGGIPIIGCACKVCLSKDFRDKRTRCAALLSYNNNNILIDCGPDIRLQLLQHNIQSIHGILITHSHYDHIVGLDELRPLSLTKPLSLYGDENSISDIKRFFPYIFDQTNVQVGGGLSQINTHIIEHYQKFTIANQEFLPIPIMHGRLSIIGYRLNNFAYLTDIKTLSDQAIQSLIGIKTLVINCLRTKPHPTHLNFKEMVHLVNIIQAKNVYCIHMDHELSHEEWLNIMPRHIKPAYDGLTIDLD